MMKWAQVKWAQSCDFLLAQEINQMICLDIALVIQNTLWGSVFRYPKPTPKLLAEGIGA